MATYAFSDLHGNYQLWEKIRDFIKPEDTVYCLGDCADRGPDGYKIIKEVLDTPNITYLIGNHEDMMLNFCSAELANLTNHRAYNLWYYNGGLVTYEAWCKDSDEEKQRVISALEKLPDYAVYINKQGKKIHLSHAGFTPMEGYDLPYRYNLIWDRDHYFDSWYKDYYKDYCVHGHTAGEYIYSDRKFCSSIPEEEYKEGYVYFYDAGHKVDIDLLTYISKRVALLNLDTLEVTYFEV